MTNKASAAVNKVYAYLYNGILSGDIPLGSPIAELEVGKALGLSRSPVREALKRMEGEGLVSHYVGRGTFVTDITVRDLEEIFELRIMFELHSLPSACVYMDCLLYTSTSLNVYGIVLFARPALSCRAVCIAENTVTDADVFVPESPLLFQSPALLRFKHLFGSVNPAGAEPERMGGVEHISDGETGVLHAGGAAAVAEYDDDGRSAVKRIAV